MLARLAMLAGALTAWAWGFHRTLDALNMIDASRVGVTGCSRLEKSALEAGLFDSHPLQLPFPRRSEKSPGIFKRTSWRIASDGTDRKSN
ncbi:hypothetical protein QR685DRAFT_511452 [Neurospora intermedia]|uniref:(4-O-methyl)-D-glucuronate--lignin esterase n=1 Tax=Neurospora intermedia TaxID=5142 RepID=A0ABR3DQS8_NEUIN